MEAEKTDWEIQKQRNIDLLEAARNNDPAKVKELLDAGADAKNPITISEDAWSSDSASALFEAVSSFKGDEQKYCEVVELLMKNGANPGYIQSRGNWSRSYEGESLRDTALGTVLGFKDASCRQKVVELLFSSAEGLNKPHRYSNKKGFSGGSVGYSKTTYPIFDLMDKAGMIDPWAHGRPLKKEDREALQKQQEAKMLQMPGKVKGGAKKKGLSPRMMEDLSLGKKRAPAIDASFIEMLLKDKIDTNQVRSYSWTSILKAGVESDDPPREWASHYESESILHRAIKNSAVGVVKVLLERGVDPNEPKCSYVYGGGKRAQNISCSSLDLALDISKNQEIIDLLTSKGAVADNPEMGYAHLAVQEENKEEEEKKGQELEMPQPVKQKASKSRSKSRSVSKGRKKK